MDRRTYTGKEIREFLEKHPDAPLKIVCYCDIVKEFTSCINCLKYKECEGR